MGYDTGEQTLDFNDDSSNTNDYEESEETHGTSNAESPILKQLINFEETIFAFRQAMRGFEKVGHKWIKNQFPLAGEKFIAKAYAGLKSVMSQGSVLVDGDETMLVQMLLENILNLIRVAYDDPSISEPDFSQIYMMYSNCLEVWYQVVDSGKGKEDIKQMMIGVYKEIGNNDMGDPYSFGNLVRGINRK